MKQQRLIPIILRPEPRSLERYEHLKTLMQISDQITQIGWKVDRERINYHIAACKERADIYTQKVCELMNINVSKLGKAGTGQTQAIKDYFFKDHNAPIVVRDKRTKKEQLNTAALVEYATTYAKESYGPAAAALYGLRKNKKYLQYCEAYKVLSAKDGRIHSSFFPYGTKTGRWTSASRMSIQAQDGSILHYSANLQQVPQQEAVFNFGAGDVKLVESLRDIFIADDGCVVGSADFEALELRLIAYLFNVTKLIKAIDNNEDVHWTNARALFAEMKLPEVYDANNKIHKKARNGAKSCAYAMSYQYSQPDRAGKYPTLFKTLKASFPKITEGLVSVMAQRFFELYPEIQEAQQQVRNKIDEVGYREIAISGRRLYYPSSMRGYNSGINFTFQSTGAELINRAMIELYKTCNYKISSFYMLASIHDEIVFNIPKQFVETATKLIETEMSKPAQFGHFTAGVPAKLKVGRSWPK